MTRGTNDNDDCGIFIYQTKPRWLDQRINPLEISQPWLRSPKFYSSRHQWWGDILIKVKNPTSEILRIDSRKQLESSIWQILSNVVEVDFENLHRQKQNLGVTSCPKKIILGELMKLLKCIDDVKLDRTSTNACDLAKLKFKHNPKSASYSNIENSLKTIHFTSVQTVSIHIG